MAEAILTGAIAVCIGGAIMIVSEKEKEKEATESKRKEKDIYIEETPQEKFWRKRREADVDAIEKWKIMKLLENQFIDEFPELSLQERVDLSRKIVRIKAEW